jgi:uncharacterized SAM-binding protein YcdF (DUF218 family)
MNLKLLNFKLILKVIMVFSAFCTAVICSLMIIVFAKFDGSAELPSDCALVFGAAVHKKSSAGPGISRRVETAVNLYLEEQIQKLVFTGGKGSSTQESEAYVMKSYAQSLGVNSDDIVLEENALSTWQNILYSKPILDKMGCESVIGISDRYHLARIEYLSFLQGWGNLRTLPAERRANALFEFRAVVRETFGIIYYFIFEQIL